MDFKNCVVGGEGYGEMGLQGSKDKKRDYEKDARPSVEKVDFRDPDFFKLARVGNPKIKEFLLCLSLCHSIIVEDDPNEPGNLIYNSASPDELALVNFAKYSGFEYRGINNNN